MRPNPEVFASSKQDYMYPISWHRGTLIHFELVLYGWFLHHYALWKLIKHLNVVTIVFIL